MKTQVPFETYPVNAAVDPSGCFAMKLKDLQIVNDDSVFEEVVKEKTLPMSPELLEFGFRCVLSTMAERVSKDCRPRKVGNILKATPYLRGKLKSPYSAFDKNTCSCAIVFTSLSGLEKSVNTDKYIQFVNTKTGTRVIIDRIAYEGCVDSSQIATIMRGKGIASRMTAAAEDDLFLRGQRFAEYALAVHLEHSAGRNGLHCSQVLGKEAVGSLPHDFLAGQKTFGPEGVSRHNGENAVGAVGVSSAQGAVQIKHGHGRSPCSCDPGSAGPPARRRPHCGLCR